MDFGFDVNGAGNNGGNANPDSNNDVTNLHNGKPDTGDTTDLDDNNNDDGNKSKNVPPHNNPDDNNGNVNNNNTEDEIELVVGGTVEIGDNIYTIDESKNLVDKDGNIFKKADEVQEFLKGFDVDNNVETESNLANIQKAIGIDITDENDKPVEFEDTPEGIASYVKAVISNSEKEHYETAINTLYQRYPIVKDFLEYYVANGGSYEGFGEMPDYSGIEIKDDDEKQQENIIRVAWDAQGRAGDVESYINYLKSQGILGASAKTELEALKKISEEQRNAIAQQAQEQEQARMAQLQEYWTGVKSVIDSKSIAGYKIPDTIVITRNGQKVSATPNDFFNYLYQVDENGHSAYERDLMQQKPVDRRDDEILRAYLTFTGGSYANLIDMAVNDKEVKQLKLRAKQNNNVHRVKVTPPKNNNAPIDFGY